MSTLRFGLRAKSIKNKVKQNAERSAKELLVALAASDAKVEKITELIFLIQAALKQQLAQCDIDEKD